MAFPSPSRRSHDPDFFKPLDAQDFGQGQAHVARATEAGFLFRIDAGPAGRVVILVQSAVKPDWEYAFHNAGYLLAAPPDYRPFDPYFAQGQLLQFRLVANPTKRLREDSCRRDGNRVDAKWVGKRVAVPADQFYDWLARRAAPAGFSIDRDSTTVQPGYVYVNGTRDGRGYRLRSVRYDGVLTVSDAIRFRESLVHGIGSAKGFGFGLLSVKRAEPWTT
jgi:CRISPR system Cascade subunit CasE